MVADKPPIKLDLIPFTQERIADTRAYARRHYGIDRARLIDPKVIVVHFTGSDTYSSAHNTFVPNQPDIELHEKPGLCAHFIVDKDGTIYEQNRLKWICRHTVGLNYTAIGIEHVGTSDSQVLNTSRELTASLKLTRWLMAKFHISRKNVIGHAESLSSPYHKERVARLKNQTHGDFVRGSMNVYRRKL